MMSANPSNILGLTNGIKTGLLADLTIVDPNKEWTFGHEHIKSKSENTPFIGTNLTGQVKQTIVRGETTYEAS